MLRSVSWILVFLATLVVAAPAVAIAGTLIEGPGRPFLLAVAGAMVAFTGWRAIRQVRMTAPAVGGTRMRMLAIAGIVVAVALLFAAACVVWLFWGVFAG